MIVAPNQLVVRGRAILPALLCLSVVLNGFLAWRIYQWQEIINPHIQQLSSNTVVPAFKAKDINGHDVHFDYDPSNRTVLYIFSPKCGWCTKNLPNLLTLQAHAGDGYRLIGISLSSDGLKEYVQAHGLTFPIFTDLAPDVLKAYHLSVTPQTVIISEQRKVIKVWTGAYNLAVVKELQNRLSLTLPGPVL